MATFREIQTRDQPDLEAHDGSGSSGIAVSSGIPRALVALVAALVVWSVPYAVPGLERFRPWTPGSSPPFVELFRRSSAGPMVAEAAGGVSSTKRVTKQERELLRFAGAPSPTKPGDPSPTKTGQPPSAQRASAQRASAPFASALGALKIQIPKKDYARVKVRIEDPKGAMKPFHRALARTARKEAGALTRISQWGDSATAPDKITAVARLLLQRRFGDGGHGFILAAPATRWYRYAGVVFSAKDWKKKRITHGNARDKRYGLGGVRAIGTPKSTTKYAPVTRRSVGKNTSRFDVYYLAGPGQGELSLRVDHQKPRIVSARAATWKDAVHRIKVADAPHKLTLGIKRGRVSVYGVVLERDGPGVVYDNLGLVGYASKRVLNADAEHFKQQLTFREPDLMVLMFGGNYLSHPFFSRASYEKSFARSVQRFRAARPQASCLVLGPLDHGEKHQGKVRTVPKLLTMIAVQRKVALDNGCAFYNFFEAMGGEGTMARWFATRPRLVLHDYAHVTRYGARILGSLLYRTLVAGFVDHLEGKPAASKR